MSGDKNLIQTIGFGISSTLIISARNPLLGTFQNNGGPTPTLLPQPGSPVIDAGDDAYAAATDQRGFARIAGGAIDIGAVELPSAVLVTNTNDSGPGSLRDALSEVAALRQQSDSEGLPAGFLGSTIAFAPSLAGERITLDSDLDIDLTVTIDGSAAPGLVLSGNATRLVVVENSGNATLMNITLENGTGNGGGAIVNQGILTLQGVTLQNNQSNPQGTMYGTTGGGGGLLNLGTATVIDSTFTKNIAENGPGGAIDNEGRLTLTDDTIAGNMGSTNGGVYNNGTTIILDTILAQNTASALGVTSADVQGNPVDSLGFNLIGQVGSSAGWISSDLLNVNPNLEPLASNGGPTQTMAFNRSSPAINAGGDLASLPSTDQRGLARVVSGHTDIGAYQEQDYLSLATVTMTYGGTATVTATLTDAGAPLVGQTILFKLNGRTIGSATTGSNGVAAITNDALPVSNTGTYSGSQGLTASFMPATTTGLDQLQSSANLIVTPAPLTITVASASRVYGASNPSFSGTVTGLLNSDTLNVAYTTTATTTSDVVAAGYPITASITGFSNAADYTVTTVLGALTITPATPTITWANPADVTYGAPLSATQLDAVVTGVGGVTLNPTLTYSEPVGAILSAGAGQTLSVLSAALTDYTSATASALLNVNPAPLTITANNADSVVGAKLPQFSASYSGFVAGDTAASLATAPTFATSATCKSGAGQYPINVSGAYSPNYAITYVPGTLTVNGQPVAPSLSLSVANEAFNGSPIPITDTVTGGSGIAGQTLDGIPLTVTYYADGSTTPLAGAPTVAGLYTVVVSFPGDAVYTPASASAEFTIAPVVNSLLPPSGPTAGGESLTIVGAGFSTLPSQDVVTIGGAPASVTAATSTQLTVTCPPGFGMNQTVAVTVSGASASNVPAFNYDPPAAVSLNPLRGFTGGGTTVTINGTDFSSNAALDSVAIGGVPVPIKSASATQLVITTPAGVGANLPVIIQVAGQASNSLTFTYANLAAPGSFSPDGLAPGTLAQPGYYVPGYGATSETPADPGYYVSATGAASEMEAQPGSYDPGAANTAAISAAPGYYVPGTGATSETPAPIGSYDSGTGNSAPIPAKAGFYVATTGSATETAAPAGSFDSGTGNSAPILASPGYYVPTAGSASETEAQAGYYVPNPGATAEIADPPFTTSGPGATYWTPTHATALALSASVGAPLYGQPVSFKATVSPLSPGDPTPTGSVQFMVDGSPLGGLVALVNGIALSPAIATLSATNHTVTAAFTDSPGVYLASTAVLTGGLRVSPAPTATTLVSSMTPGVAGIPLTLTATVAALSPGGGTPQGSVTFKNGSTVLGAAPLALVNGVDQASLTTSSLPAGTDAVTATYVNSDGNDLGSAATLNQVVLGPGVTVVGATLYVVGASTSDYVQISPSGAKTDGTTGLTVSATLNNAWISKTFGQTFTAVAVYGLAGNDDVQLASTLTLPTTIVEGNGSDYVLTAAGNDTITLGSGNDQVFGLGGNKTVTAQDAAGGSVYVQLGAGNDTVQLGAGNDQVTLGDGANVVSAGNGNDQVTGGNGGNVITLGNGNDYVHTGNGNDVITLGIGNETILVGNGNKTISAGNGNSYVSAGAGNDSVTLGSGNDVVELGAGADTVALGNGNDYVSAGNGNDVVSVGNGNDTVELGGGGDVVVEGNGNDYVSAGNGNDLVVGGLGQHTIQLGNGNDVLIDGAVTVTQAVPGDSLLAILAAWQTGKVAAASLRPRLAVTFNTAHANTLMAGTGTNWFVVSNPKDYAPLTSKDSVSRS